MICYLLPVLICVSAIRIVRINNSDVPLKVFLEQFSSQNPEFFAHFSRWLTSLADMDPNWKFWVNFVFRDTFSYFSLFSFFPLEVAYGI